MSIYSGVLPFSITDSGIFFLIGQEKSGLWSDFGGKIETGESSIDCAIREAREESMGFLNIKPEDLKLKLGNARATIYACKINYNPDLPDLYNSSYQYHQKVFASLLSKYQNLNTHFNRIGYLEKTQMKWVSYFDYINMRSVIRKISIPLLDEIILLIIMNFINDKN